MEIKQFYERFDLPPPKLSPDMRQRRRLSYRNERCLYYRNCDATGRRLLSIYSEDKPFPVYDNNYWWSDDWDPLDFGREFDFSRTFIEQFVEMRSLVPHRALNVLLPTMENSDFCNQVGFVKNCYLLFDSRRSENCSYGKTNERCYDCVDCLKVFDCEGCYEVVNAQSCQFCTYLFDSQNSNDCHFSSNLIGCKNCFGSVNLRNKQYYFFNQKCTKEQWNELVNNIHSEHSVEQIFQQFIDFKQQQFVKWMQERNTENCTGDYLVNCKNCWYCFDSEYLEDCHYCFDLKKDNAPNISCVDCSHFGGDLEYCYECCSIGNACSRLMFCENVWNSSDVSYSQMCNQCSNLFGCVSMRRKEYCIFNKQYTESDFFGLRERIIAHMKETREWGEFFPINSSPFDYNETLAQEYFPVSKEQALENTWGWKEEQEKQVEKNFVPNTAIEGITDDVLNTVFTCGRSGKPYRITAEELRFYRKMGLRLPKYCFEQRHLARLASRNPRILHKRRCEVSGEQLWTTVEEGRPEKLLSEKAYYEAI